MYSGGCFISGNMFLHFLSFRNASMVWGWVGGWRWGWGWNPARQGLCIHVQNHSCWWLRDARSQDISGHSIESILSKYSSLRTRRVDTIRKQAEWGNNKEAIFIAKNKMCIWHSIWHSQIDTKASNYDKSTIVSVLRNQNAPIPLLPRIAMWMIRILRLILYCAIL